MEQAVFFILGLVALGLELWALVDCARHRPNAFEATGKRTKTFWLAVTGGSALVGVISLLGAGGGLFGTFGLFGLVAVVAASVYLADVRPAVKDAGRGGSRNMGPYGPW
ncbi:membrane protein [Arthrobacter liuii]|uniref:Membrane protein n=1 Tax=Arthrobacter liuii TaxID=1476996 RepID=A0ABQ2AXG7_9MICC|nr:membrane protein [Arthrobacter liuii]